MVRTTTTISLDSELKNQATKIIEEKYGKNKLSFYIELCLKSLIKRNEKEV